MARTRRLSLSKEELAAGVVWGQPLEIETKAVEAYAVSPLSHKLLEGYFAALADVGSKKTALASQVVVTSKRWESSEANQKYLAAKKETEKFQEKLAEHAMLRTLSMLDEIIYQKPQSFFALDESSPYRNIIRANPHYLLEALGGVPSLEQRKAQILALATNPLFAVPFVAILPRLLNANDTVSNSVNAVREAYTAVESQFLTNLATEPSFAPTRAEISEHPALAARLIRRVAQRTDVLPDTRGMLVARFPEGHRVFVHSAQVSSAFGRVWRSKQAEKDVGLVRVGITAAVTSLEAVLSKAGVSIASPVEHKKLGLMDRLQNWFSDTRLGRALGIKPVSFKETAIQKLRRLQTANDGRLAAETEAARLAAEAEAVRVAAEAAAARVVGEVVAQAVCVAAEVEAATASLSAQNQELLKVDASIAQVFSAVNGLAASVDKIREDAQTKAALAVADSIVFIPVPSQGSQALGLGELNENHFPDINQHAGDTGNAIAALDEADYDNVDDQQGGLFVIPLQKRPRVAALGMNALAEDDFEGNLQDEETEVTSAAMTETSSGIAQPRQEVPPLNIGGICDHVSQAALAETKAQWDRQSAQRRENIQQLERKLSECPDGALDQKLRFLRALQSEKSALIEILGDYRAALNLKHSELEKELSRYTSAGAKTAASGGSLNMGGLDEDAYVDIHDDKKYVAQTGGSGSLSRSARASAQVGLLTASTRHNVPELDHNQHLPRESLLHQQCAV